MNNQIIFRENAIIHREILPDNKLQFIAFEGNFLQIEKRLRKSRSEVNLARNKLYQLRSDYKDGYIKLEDFQSGSKQYEKLIGYYSRINKVYINKFKSKVEYINSLNFFISKFNSELWQERQNQAKWFPNRSSVIIKHKKKKKAKIHLTSYPRSMQKNIKKIIEISKRLRLTKKRLHYDDENQYIHEDISEFIKLADRLRIPYHKFIIMNRFKEYEELIFQLFYSSKVILLKVGISDKIISLIHHFMFNNKDDLNKTDYNLLGIYEQFFKWLFNDVNYNDKRSYDQKIDDYVDYLLETTPPDYKFK